MTDATGYARGVRDAAGVASRKASGRFREAAVCHSDRSRKHMHTRADEAGQIAAAILTLLPAEKEPRT